MVVSSIFSTATRIWLKYWSVFQSNILFPFHLAGNKGTTCSNNSAVTFIAPAIKGRSAQNLPHVQAGLSSHNDHPAPRAIGLSGSFDSHSRLLCTPPRTERGTRAGKDTKRKVGEGKKTRFNNAVGAGGLFPRGWLAAYQGLRRGLRSTGSADTGRCGRSRR
jgi:hypothetical protein